MAKDKVWYDIPRIGSKHKGGWEYRGYVTDYSDIKYQSHDFEMQGLEIKILERERPKRWDFYTRKKLPKSKSKFID